MIELREYAHESADYRAALKLRLAVLRRPLGLAFETEDLANEVSDIHLGAFDGESIVGTLILTPEGSAAKMRQVAVWPDRQAQGVGSRLVAFSEAYARAAGFTTMVLHARESAVAFYESLGYSTVGEPFEEVTIPHRSMEKSLVKRMA
jgi:ribosomal protein S18 acetylase RimI-like enzyme